MKIDSGTMVELHYELFDEQGTLVETSEEDGPIRYKHGAGEILPGLERALHGATAEEELSVTLACADAYGEMQPEGLIVVPRSELPGDAELNPGDWITVHVQPEKDDEEEGELEARVAEVNPEDVVLDANHPLAGQDVTFKVKILSVEAGGA